MASPPAPPRPSAATTSPTKKPQPMPWTHQETLNLIKAYQEKWYSLKRGQLRTNQWEEVAVTVAARCGYDYNEPSKSAIQCRHKMEKLRQRYRTEKQRLATASTSGSRGLCSYWQYYQLMEKLELGPLPISARPLAPCSYNSEDVNVNIDDGRYVVQEDEDEEEEDEDDIYGKSRSMNCILQQRRPNFVDSFNGGMKIFAKDPSEKKRWRFMKEAREEMEDEEVAGKGGKRRDLMSELAAEIRIFGERFIGLQNLQMEITKETERCRLEMENKKMEMILKSQKIMVDSIEKVFGFSKKMRMSHDILKERVMRIYEDLTKIVSILLL